MKKTSILASVTIAVLLLAYFVQVYFMSAASNKAYEKVVAYKSPYYTILDSNITKGLFNSKAEFLVKINADNILNSLDESEQSYRLIRLLKTIELNSINLIVNTKNNIFAKNNIEILLANPSYDEKAKESVMGVKYPLSAYFDLSLSSKIKGDLTLKLADMDAKMGRDKILSKNTYLLLKDFSSSLKFSALELNSDSLVAGSDRDSINIEKLNYVENFKEAIDIKQYHEAYVLGKGFFEAKGVLSLEKIKLQDGANINKIKLETQLEKNNEESFNMPFKFSIAEIVNKGLDVKNIKLDLNANNISTKWFNAISLSSGDEFYFDLFSSTSPNIKLNDFSITINDANISTKAEANFDKGITKANANVVSDKKPSQIHLMFALLGFDHMFVQKDEKYVLEFIYDDSDKNNITAKLNENDVSQAFKNIPYGFSQDIEEPQSEADMFMDENLSDEEGMFNGEVKNPNSTN